MSDKVAKRIDGERTRQKILRVAERLFADIGYDGVSIRRITSESNVELSAVNYHFESKQNLFKEVMAMRVTEMNSKRLALINQVKFESDIETYLIELLDAFCKPFTDEDKQSGDLSAYRRLLASVINHKRWQTVLMTQHYDPIVQILIENIKRHLKLPHEEDIYWYISFFLATLANAFAETGRVDRLSKGRCDSSNLRHVKEKLIKFTVGGLLRDVK